jgi:hypothetical protein
MSQIKRVVLDVLKPHDPGLIAFATAASEVAGVSGVNATLVETDREVETLKLTIEGEAIDHEAVTAAVEDLGGSVHSVDQVACGEHLVEDSPTLQD